jgi:hypothetical protein
MTTTTTQQPLINIDFTKVKRMSPSDLLQIAIDGLIENAADPLFKPDMDTYGEKKYGICFGCLATCGLAKLNGVLYSETVQKLSELHVDHFINFSNVASIAGWTQKKRRDLEDYELAIDEARQGDLESLFEFCNIWPDDVRVFRCNFILDTDDWREQLPAVEAKIAELKATGF